MSEKERLAQALRDGDMATFTKAIRHANRGATLDVERCARIEKAAALVAWLGASAGVGDPTDRALDALRDALSDSSEYARLSGAVTERPDELADVIRDTHPEWEEGRDETLP